MRRTLVRTRAPSFNSLSRMVAAATSAATMAANQLRMWFSAMAYVLLDILRRVGLRYTQSP